MSNLIKSLISLAAAVVFLSVLGGLFRPGVGGDGFRAAAQTVTEEKEDTDPVKELREIRREIEALRAELRKLQPRVVPAVREERRTCPCKDKAGRACDCAVTKDCECETCLCEHAGACPGRKVVRIEVLTEKPKCECKDGCKCCKACPGKAVPKKDK